jgi:DNA modification methylase
MREWISEDGRVRLINGDCLDVLPTLGRVDACVTDPPYGISYFHSGGGGGGIGNPEAARAKAFFSKSDMITGDNIPFDPSHLLHFKKIVLFGANHYSDKLPKSAKWLIWDKIVVPETYGKFSFADCEMAWTNAKGTARIYKHLWQGCRRSGESNKGGKLHPNRKPVELMMWCMNQIGVEKDDVVLDPYMGSGTTCLACLRLGFSFIGIEIDPRYFKVAVARVQAAMRQQTLDLGV